MIKIIYILTIVATLNFEVNQQDIMTKFHVYPLLILSYGDALYTNGQKSFTRQCKNETMILCGLFLSEKYLRSLNLILSCRNQRQNIVY